MMNKIYIIICFFFLSNSFIFSSSQCQTINRIIIKVGASIITSEDVRNEILTNLTVAKIEISQENINKYKDYAIKSLIKNSIKKSEINKYKIENFNKEDLENYISNIDKKFADNPIGLKEIFKENNINYEVFIEKFKTELLWNTLIYSIYKNQININVIDIENEIEQVTSLDKEKYTTTGIDKLRDKVIVNKKQEKLSLYSRSHYSNLESLISIKFQ
jgi:hypothetical protein